MSTSKPFPTNALKQITKKGRTHMRYGLSPCFGIFALNLFCILRRRSTFAIFLSPLFYFAIFTFLVTELLFTVTFTK